MTPKRAKSAGDRLRVAMAALRRIAGFRNPMNTAASNMSIIAEEALAAITGGRRK